MRDENHILMYRNNTIIKFIFIHSITIVLFILIGFVFNSFPVDSFIAGGDFYQFINQENTLHRYLYTWFNESGQGQYSPIFVAFLYYLLQIILVQMGASTGVMVSFIVTSFLLLSYYSFFSSTYILDLNIKYRERIVFSLLYSMNLFSFSILAYTWGFSHHFIIYIFIPLLISVFYRIVRYGGLINYSIYALITLLSIVSYSNVAFLLALFFVQSISIIPILFYRKRYIYIKRVIASFFLQTFLISFILIIFYLSYRYQVDNITNSQILNPLSWLSSNSSGVLNSFNLVMGEWSFPNTRDIRFNVYQQYFIFSSVLTLVPILIIILSNIRKTKKNIYEWFLWSGFLLLTILTVRIASPFESINSIFYTYTLGLFRSPDKLFSFYPYFVSTLALFGYYKVKWNYKYLLFPLLLAPSLFFMIGGVEKFLSKKVISTLDGYEYRYTTQIPQEYYDIQSKYFSGAESTSTTIISLPFSVVNSINWVNYPKWNYVGNDITRFLWNKNQIIANTYDHPVLENKFSFQEFNDNQTGTKEELLSLLQKFSGEYIIFHKDIVSYRLDQSKYIKSKIDELEESQDIIKLEDNDYFILYKLADKNLYPLIYSDNTNINFYRINPTKYNIEVKGIKEKTDIRFNQSFNKLWTLYSSNKDKQCDTLQSYNLDKSIINECKFSRTFFEGEELSYLWRQPVFEDSHKLVYDYANQWTIDPEYIKSNFDKSMYKENPDGSIDLELTLYFKPQSYFYLGIIISGTTLILCLGYLGYAFYHKRGANLSPHPALRATLASSQGGLKSEGQKGSEGQNTIHPHLAGTPSKGGQNASERQIKGENKSKSVIKIKK